MLPPAVVDTNVVVSGLLTTQANSPVARILDGMLAAAFAYVISDALLAEYRTVLRRTPLRKVHRLTSGEIDAVLVDLAQHAIVLGPVLGPVLAPVPTRSAPDPGDQHLWELLALRDDLVLVTGDKRLHRDRSMGSRILAPAAFVERWMA